MKRFIYKNNRYNTGMRGPEYLESHQKRALDLAIISGAIPMTSPLWMVMSLYNNFRHQPLIFSQKRMGKNQQPFNMLKFETLYKGAENSQEHDHQLSCNSSEREISDPRIPNKFLKVMRRGFRSWSGTRLIV